MRQLFTLLRCCTPLVILLLSACTLPGPKETPPSVITPEWLQHRQTVEKITRYQAGGSLLYTSGFKKEYARFFLQQNSIQDYRLMLLTPMGNTELDLKVKGGIVETTNSKGQHYRSDNLEHTLYKLTGMALPLDSIRLWILGLPGETKQFQISADNRLKSALLDTGEKEWNVQYQSYDKQIIPALPDRLEMSNGEQKIKLKIDSWKL